jgi:hypothetical protein
MQTNNRPKPKKNNCCFSANVKKTVCRSEINFIYFFLILFPIQVIALQIDKHNYEFSLNWTKSLYTAHMQNCLYLNFALVANTKMCSVFLEQIRIFF